MKNRCSQNRLLAPSLALGLCVAMLPILIAQGHLARAASGTLSDTAAPPHTLIRSWGDNGSGQLGIGRNHGFSFPVTTHVLTDTVALAAGDNYTLALEGDGSVWGWGSGGTDQLGDIPQSCALGGEVPCSVEPRRVPGLPPITALVTSGAQNYAVALALDRSGHVWAWGSTGHDLIDTDAPLPLDDVDQCPFPSGADAVYCLLVPHRVPGLSGIRAIAMSAEIALALRSDGTVWTWGDLDSALGRTISRTQPAEIPNPVPHLHGVVAISMGDSPLLLKGDGTVWTWGTDRSIPAYNHLSRVALPTGVVTVAAGPLSNFAILRDGTVWGWTYDASLTEPCETLPRGRCWTEPHLLADLTHVRAIAPALSHTLALRDDGTVLAWGQNEHGQLGLGYNSHYELAPHRVPGLSHVTAIAAGEGHSAAVTQRTPAGR